MPTSSSGVVCVVLKVRAASVEQRVGLDGAHRSGSRGAAIAVEVVAQEEAHNERVSLQPTPLRLKIPSSSMPVSLSVGSAGREEANENELAVGSAVHSM
jgi:hypothetical protein